MPKRRTRHDAFGVIGVTRAAAKVVVRDRRDIARSMRRPGFV